MLQSGITCSPVKCILIELPPPTHNFQIEQLRLKAAVTLQSHWRSYSVQQLYRDKLLHQKQLRLQGEFRAAQLIQAFWRGFSNRKIFASVLKAKQLLRIEKSRKETERMAECATIIQAHWRGYRLRCTALASLRKYRILKSKEELDRKFIVTVIVIQSLWRGYLVRKECHPVLIKRMVEWQKNRDRKRYIAAIKLQAFWRGCCIRLKVNKIYFEQRRQIKLLEEQQEQAARILQAYWRKYYCRSCPNQKTLQNNECLQEFSSAECTSGTSGKLTITRRLQSALKLKSLDMSSSIDHVENSRLNSTKGVASVGGSLEGDAKIKQEEHACSLEISDEGVAIGNQNRVRTMTTEEVNTMNTVCP